MSLITLPELKQILPFASAARLQLFQPLLDATLAEFEIDDPVRMAAFLAQIAHESGSLKYVKELASGNAYEGRSDLGNSTPGDGPRYKGRGLIQITGRKNYGLLSNALGLDLIGQPELLEQPEAACRSAGWFWRVGAGLNLSKRAKAHGIPEGCDLNTYADVQDFESITLAINGGLNGLEDRTAYWERAKVVLT